MSQSCMTVVGWQSAASAMSAYHKCRFLGTLHLVRLSGTSNTLGSLHTMSSVPGAWQRATSVVEFLLAWWFTMITVLLLQFDAACVCCRVGADGRHGTAPPADASGSMGRAFGEAALYTQLSALHRSLVNSVLFVSIFPFSFLAAGHSRAIQPSRTASHIRTKCATLRRPHNECGMFAAR